MVFKEVPFMRIAIGFVLLGLTVTAADRPPNVVVILADQLQANRLHTYGNPRPTSPNIDALAAAGVKFNHFYSVAPWTAPSQGTIATSLYPSRHGETLFMQRTSPPAFTPDTVTPAQTSKVRATIRERSSIMRWPVPIY